MLMHYSVRVSSQPESPMKRMIAICMGRKLVVWKALLFVFLLLHTQSAHAALQDMVGRYVGAWTNITFGSTGKAVILIQISGTNATLTFDMDGQVFGYVNPPVI